MLLSKVIFVVVN